MADEKKTETNQGQVHTNDFGTIHVDDEVVASVAAIALGEVEGVVRPQPQSNDSLFGSVTDNVAGMFGKKNQAKGVRVDYKNDGFYIILTLKVKYGYNIPDLAHEVQRRVKSAVEKMTGLRVHTVDLFVQTIVFENSNENVTGVQYA